VLFTSSARVKYPGRLAYVVVLLSDLDQIQAHIFSHMIDPSDIISQPYIPRKYIDTIEMCVHELAAGRKVHVHCFLQGCVCG
jgi:hypothetical protein